MASIQSQITFSVVLLALFSISLAAITELPAKDNVNAPNANKKPEDTWTPVTEPKEFKINVADGIRGANQVRYEKWDKGTMTGMFSKPLGDKKWEIVTYIADAGGYRILSTKVVDESELAGIQAGAATELNTAQVEVTQDGTKHSYTVTTDQIAKSEEEQKKQQKPA